MHFHCILKILVEMFKVGHIAIDEIVYHFIGLFYFEIEEDVGFAGRFGGFGGQLELVPPL